MEEHLVEIFLQQKLVIKMQQKQIVEKTQKRVFCESSNFYKLRLTRQDHWDEKISSISLPFVPIA
jgi:hypothetical protein